MNNFHILAIVAIVTASSLFAGMVVPAVAQDNMTMGMGMDNSSMGMNQMDNMTMGMGMDNSSMGMNDGSAMK